MSAENTSRFSLPSVKQTRNFIAHETDEVLKGAGLGASVATAVYAFARASEAVTNPVIGLALVGGLFALRNAASFRWIKNDRVTTTSATLSYGGAAYGLERYGHEQIIQSISDLVPVI